ncbi:MAG: hypothetical protein N2246_05350 [Candidatus Sumerlaeia bacterium]|nr:hypothetical protein [Candidatus Sumerlaeia bacterium]
MIIRKKRVFIVLGVGLLILNLFVSFAQQQIIKKEINVLAPNGGEVLNVGQQYLIPWNAARSINTVGIQLINYARTPHLVYNVVSVTPNTGQYLWVVPAVEPGKLYKIKIYNNAQISTFDESDQPFTILGGASPTPTPQSEYNPAEFIKVLSPASGDIWYKNKQYTIRWETKSPETKYVSILLSFDNGETYNSRIYVRANAQKKKYDWKIPKEIYSSPNCRIKIIDAQNPYYYGVSGRFSILKQGEQPQSLSKAPTPTPAGGVPAPTPSPTPVSSPAPQIGTLDKSKVTPRPTSKTGVIIGQ